MSYAGTRKRAARLNVRSVGHLKVTSSCASRTRGSKHKQPKNNSTSRFSTAPLQADGAAQLRIAADAAGFGPALPRLVLSS
jgi:hypothetical protein